MTSWCMELVTALMKRLHDNDKKLISLLERYRQKSVKFNRGKVAVDIMGDLLTVLSLKLDANKVEVTL